MNTCFTNLSETIMLGGVDVPKELMFQKTNKTTKRLRSLMYRNDAK